MDAWWKRLWQRTFARSSGFPPPADPALVSQFRGWFAEQLAKHPEISIERRGEYARAASVLFERMTPTALLRLVLHAREIRFYPNREDMTVSLARTFRGVFEELLQGTPIGGGYDGAGRCLHLDGGDEDHGDRGIVMLYAHEFVHGIDGPRKEITRSRQWREAWQEEILPQELSPLALVSPEEGFAEFGKLMYSGILDRRHLKKHYPRCVAVWREQGLW